MSHVRHRPSLSVATVAVAALGLLHGVADGRR
jgi:hydrogenase/urease accessory protein HupE